MERTAIDAVEPAAFGGGVDRRSLTDVLGATDLAVNHYRIPPGEGFPGGLHAHGDQEELFVVLDGEATFETLVARGQEDSENEGGEREIGKCEGDERAVDEYGADEYEARKYEAGEVTIGAGEAIRFAPGEYQSGRNGGETTLVALALGAPRDSEDVRIPLACPECGHDYLRPEVGEDDDVRLVCSDCDAENAPEGCPDCGSEMRVAFGDAPVDEPDRDPGGRPETVAVCPDCGAEAATPFRSR